MTAALAEHDLHALAGMGARRAIRRGSVLFFEGERCDRVVVLLEGRVKVRHDTADGREVLLAVRGPGELLGDLSALDGESASATVTALDDLDVSVVSAQDFTQFLEERPRLLLGLVRSMGRRIREVDRRRIEFAAQDATGRVAQRLVEVCEQYGCQTPEGTRMELSLTQQEIAAWTGCSREAVSRALRGLRARGWLSTGRRSVVLHDAAALRRRAGH